MADDGTPPEGGNNGGGENGDKGGQKPRLVGLEGKRFPARDEDYAGANDEALAIRLSILEEEHRALDLAIGAMEDRTPYDRLAIARLKKRKLQLKDKIQEIKDAMLPDIIA